MNRFAFAALIGLLSTHLKAFESELEQSAPQLLHMSELKELAGSDPAAATLEKLNDVLSTPFVFNRERSGSPRVVPPPSTLRVVF